MNNTPFQILSLSGGGYKGIFSLSVLCRLQEQLEVKSVYESVDAFIGTSVGSIIACGLALNEITPSEIRDLFKDNGKKIFPGNCGVGYFKSKYDPKYLMDILNEIFEDRTFMDLDKPCYVTTVDAETRRTLLIGGHKDSIKHYSTMPITDAILASISAPAYFPFYRFEYPKNDQDNPGSNGWLVDGGISANAPELFAMSDIKQDFGLQIEDFFTLSIGTTSDVRRISYLNETDREMKWGALRWILNRELPLTDLIFSSQVNMTCRVMENIIKSDKYIRLDKQIDGKVFEMDDYKIHEELKKEADDFVDDLLTLPRSITDGHRTALFLSRN